jgi:hypothetical protein
MTAEADVSACDAKRCGLLVMFHCCGAGSWAFDDLGFLLSALGMCTCAGSSEAAEHLLPGVRPLWVYCIGFAVSETPSAGFSGVTSTI